jgi:hypothetical protein
VIRLEILADPEVRIRFVADSVFCEGSSIILEQSNAELQTRWFRNAVFISTGNKLTSHTGDKIYAIGTNGLGCSDTSNILQPLMYPKPVPAIIRRSDSLFSTIVADSFQWFYNNTAISKATQRHLKLQASGNYHVEAYSEKGCKGVSVVYKYTKVSVETPFEASFVVYPNPAGKIINIDLEGIQSIKIMDAAGKTCMGIEGHSGPLDISALEPGMYVIVIYTTSSVATGTFVKSE